MAGSNEVNLNESKSIVPLNTWVLISNFKLSYNLQRRPDGTFNRDLSEFLDRRVPANINPVDGVFSFDHVDRSTGLLNRVYQPSPKDDAQWGIVDLEKPLSTTEIVPVIVFFHGGSFTHSSANSSIYDTFCRRLVSVCKAVVVSVNYRRSPEHRYPCAYDDALVEIAHHVAVRAAEADVEILGNILLHPMFGGQRRTESEKRLDSKYSSHSTTVIGIGELIYPKGKIETIRLDWQLAYVEGLRNYGHEVKLLFLEKATIGFYFLPNNDHFYCLMEEIKTFVNSNC
ncbi:Gibberellin receptor GID1A [Hibiscus syriacus]|uniref:Gibberellin receptor GID1A n=1 Tax=Hibiscus syriacus TaxID=106335 RepID=A0A6A2YQE3_HIBSY|nr:Gibberellin receptor GID1A [Hibiscus syriacus]